jgi:hypothetical protein
MEAAWRPHRGAAEIDRIYQHQASAAALTSLRAVMVRRLLEHDHDDSAVQGTPVLGRLSRAFRENKPMPQLAVHPAPSPYFLRRHVCGA